MRLYLLIIWWIATAWSIVGIFPGGFFPVRSFPRQIFSSNMKAVTREFYHHSQFPSFAGSLSKRSCLRILYHICVKSAQKDAGIEVVLYWLARLFRPSNLKQISLGDSFLGGEETKASSAMLSVVASIIWHSKSRLENHDIGELFERIVHATKLAQPECVLKASLDQLLCALCYVQPPLFQTLISTLTEGIPKVNMSKFITNLTPSKVETLAVAACSSSCIQDLLASQIPLYVVCTILEWSQQIVNTQLERCKRIRVSDISSESARTSNSPQHAHTAGYSSDDSSSMADLPASSSGMELKTLPQYSILNPHNKEELPTSVTVDEIATLLRILSRLCCQPAIQDWMGEGHGGLLWNTLFTILGDLNMSLSVGKSMTALEGATVELLKATCLNHPVNHKHIAKHLCDLIKRQKKMPSGGHCYIHSLSGFARSLVAQLLLESECMLVEVEVELQKALLGDIPIAWQPASCTTSTLHPSYGSSLNSYLLYLPLNTSVAEIVSHVTGSPADAPPANCRKASSSVKASEGKSIAPGDFSINNLDLEEPMIICMDDEMEDEEEDVAMLDVSQGEDYESAFNKLSVAAAITAKDKRNKALFNAMLKSNANKGRPCY